MFLSLFILIRIFFRNTNNYYPRIFLFLSFNWFKSLFALITRAEITHLWLVLPAIGNSLLCLGFFVKTTMGFLFWKENILFGNPVWASWSGKTSYIVQRYCGQKKCQVSLTFSVGGLDGSLPQIFSYLQNWGIPSALSDLTLALFSLLSTMEFRTKNGFPDQEAQRSFTRGKRIETQKRNDYACKKNDNRARYEGWTKPFPTLPQTGSVRGMRKLYYGSKCLLVRCGDYIYNVSSEPHIYYQTTF